MGFGICMHFVRFHLTLVVKWTGFYAPTTHTHWAIYVLSLASANKASKNISTAYYRPHRSLCCRPLWHLFKLWYIFTGIFFWCWQVMFWSLSVWDVKTWKERLVCLVLNLPFWVAFLTTFKFDPAYFPMRSIPSMAVLRECEETQVLSKWWRAISSQPLQPSPVLIICRWCHSTTPFLWHRFVYFVHTFWATRIHPALSFKRKQYSIVMWSTRVLFSTWDEFFVFYICNKNWDNGIHADPGKAS